MKKKRKVDDLPDIVKAKKQVKIKKPIKETEKKVVGIVLVSLLVFFTVLFGVFTLLYYQSPERELKLGANIENITLSEDGHKIYVRLSGGSNEKNITAVKFIFKDFEGNGYIFETTEGISNISVSYNQSFFDWLFGKSQFEGTYDYEISSEEIKGLSGFENIEEISVVFKYKDDAGDPIDTPPLDTGSPAPQDGNGGSNGGGNGDGGTTTTCTDTCASLGYECGIHVICGSNFDCDGCNEEYYCDGGECVLKKISSDFDLTGNVLILYNKNTLDAQEIAEYYADARGISYDQICPTRVAPGQFVKAGHLLGARKTIIEDCICNLILTDMTGPCVLSNINEIAEKSPITHLVIIKGIPPRLYGTPWNNTCTGCVTTVDEEGVSADYYLSLMLYMDSDNMFEEEGNGLFYPVPNYYGLNPNPIDFQIADSIRGYIRPIEPVHDRIVAYGRIEAMTKNRTFELIDRTIAAENKGVSGKFLYSYKRPLSDETAKFLKELTSDLDSQCSEYIVNFTYSKFSYENCTDWPNEICRVGMTGGEIPGEAGSIIPKAINAGIFLGNHHGSLDTDQGIWINSNNAFDGFYNMLNWRKSAEDCEPLCQNTANPQECRKNSKDYFKEINTDCVGVADGFLGWQYRSWPVQYYGFWPSGWFQLSGGSGGYGKTPPIIISGDAYQDSQFTDDKYLYFGSLDAADNPQCVLGNGTIESCPELIAVNLRYSLTLNPQIYVDGTRNFTVRFRHKNLEYENARLQIYPFVYFNVGSHYSASRYVDMSQASSEWKTEEVNFSVNRDSKYITRIILDISSSLSNTPSLRNTQKKWLELDAFELIDVETGENLLDIDISSFNSSYIGYTQAGDYASNVIDRLGGIAWWGSSSHAYTGGHAFNRVDDFAGAFYSGKSLGESLAYISDRAMSGIIYGDPLYRPSGAKIYVNEGVNELNYEREYSRKRGYIFLQDDVSKVYVNAFHGQANLDTTNWVLLFCQVDNASYCDENNLWTELMNDTKAAYGLLVYENLDGFIADFGADQDFMMKLRVWNSNEPENDLTNYGYFHYRVDSDNDNLPDDWELQYFSNLLNSTEDDPDNDGFWNIEEFMKKKSPTFTDTMFAECYLERHCSKDTYPICVNYRCRQCTEDLHCQINYPEMSFCIYNNCRQCTEDLHCEQTSPEDPFCVYNNCRECTEDLHCEQKYAKLPFCVYNYCRECIDDSDCPEDTPICKYYSCQECVEDSDCTGDNNFCIDNQCTPGCDEDLDCNDPFLPYCDVGNHVCIECLSKENCTGNEYCWFDNTCKNITCMTNSECEDFDDCSSDKCIGGYCNFAKFANQGDCYYCANFSFCNLNGGMSICGGPDINHNGSVGQEDMDIFSDWYNGPECNESNLFCDYADIDRSGFYYAQSPGGMIKKGGVQIPDLNILIALYNNVCKIEPWRACELGISENEICDDGFDNDCDGLIDCDDEDCSAFCGVVLSLSPLVRIINWFKNLFS